MRVFMLGWEFPPFISGGLGTACYGLTKAMSSLGTDIMFVLPRPVSAPFSTHVRLVSAPPNSPLAMPSTEFRLKEFENVIFRTINANIDHPYQRPKECGTVLPQVVAEVHRSVRTAPVAPAQRTHANGPGAGAPHQAQRQPQAVPAPNAPPQSNSHYVGDLFSETQLYAALAAEIARNESFDVVHAHDWMTFPAAMAVAEIKGAPLVVQVHSTEFDRSGVHVNQRIYDIERCGMHAAIKVIAVSHLTKQMCVRHYGVDPGKVEVVYNAIDSSGNSTLDARKHAIYNDEKIVLFLGRMTMQKGPEYFLAAVKKVLRVMDNVKFVMAGSGDMLRRTIEMAAQMGISHKVLFTGFLRGADVDEVFQLADLYVMPSVSEPFGIAPLEAMSHEVPVIISKQSGVSEVITHALKVDFWDIDEMANKIIAVLKHPPLARTLRQHGSIEVKRMCWTNSARRCVEVYDRAIGSMRNRGQSG